MVVSAGFGKGAASVPLSQSTKEAPNMGGDNVAVLAGFTREVLADAGSVSLHLFIDPATDMDSRFKAWDADACEWIRVDGWLFSFEDAEAAA
jgi:hypothetical protein